MTTRSRCIIRVSLRYKVRYFEYNNEETLSWTRIRLPPESPAQVPSPSIMSAALEEAVPSPTIAQAANVSRESSEVSPSFAGMRPRSICVEKNEPVQRAPEAQSGVDLDALGTAVVNPVLLSSNPGRKLSWKQKLQARKTGPAGPETANIHVGLPKKQISLVPDFAAQRREQEPARCLDNSEWRCKVVFGMGGFKGSDR